MRAPAISFGLLAGLWLLVPGELIAETPAVLAVASPFGLCPGILTEIVGRNFSKNATVEVNTQRAAVLAHWDDCTAEGCIEYLLVVFPLDLAVGPAGVVVETSAGRSAPFKILLEEYAPGLTGFIPGASLSCAEGQTASAGDLVTIRAVGLGATASGVNSPTLLTPTVAIGGQAAEVVESVLSPDPGVYHVSFRVPPGDGYHDVVLNLAGRNSNSRFLPVGRAIVHGSRAAPESIITAAACGGTFATAALASDPRDPPVSRGGTTVTVTDSAGVERLAPLLYVSPLQVNYIVPADTALGNARITIPSADATVSTGELEVRAAAPQFFTAGSLLLRVRDGVQAVESVFESATGIVRLIDMGPETDQLFLLLFGTGLRFAGNVSATVGGVNAPVTYAGPQSEFPGLDQVNMQLPRSLAGRGRVDVMLTVDAELTHVMQLVFE
ncbi:MAG: hypothetical protein HYS04_19855 [Acidobacteria bacterium]|nr:hypothetical protein [Acidobacteriota bacterium]